MLVPVDVGKRSAMSMVANQLGEMLVDPFEFPLDRAGVDVLLDQVAGAEAKADAVTGQDASPSQGLLRGVLPVWVPQCLSTVGV